MANISKINSIVVELLAKIKGQGRTKLKKSRGRPFNFGGTPTPDPDTETSDFISEDLEENGTLFGSASLVDGVLISPGSGSYTRLPMTDQFRSSTSQSMSMWFKSTHVPSANNWTRIIHSHIIGQGPNGFFLEMRSPTDFYFKGASHGLLADSDPTARAPYALNDGEWHHIALSWDVADTGNEIRMWVDGQSITVLNPTHIGAGADAKPYLFIGARQFNSPMELDKVDLNSGAIDDAEVLSRYNADPRSAAEDGYTPPSYTFGGWIEETADFISSLSGEATSVDDGQGGSMMKMSLSSDSSNTNSYGEYDISSLVSSSDPQYFAISMWVRYNQTDPLNMDVPLYRWANAGQGSTSPSLSFTFKLTHSGSSYKINATGPQNNSNGLDSYSFDTNISDLGTNWHNIVAYVDKPNLQLKFFFDGCLIGTSTIRSQFKVWASNPESQTAYIGSANRFQKTNVDFSIDSVQVIYDQQFEPYQLITVYNDATRKRVLSDTVPSPLDALTADDLLERAYLSAPYTGKTKNYRDITFENKIITLTGDQYFIDGDTSYLPDTSWSMSIWFKDQTTVDGIQRDFLSLNGYSSYSADGVLTNGFAYQLDNRTAKISRTRVHAYAPNFTQDYNDGAWHHLVVTKNIGSGNTAVIYIDGTAVKTGAPAGTWVTKNYGFGLGKFASATKEPFIGQVTNLEVWDQELTSSDVANLYLLGHAPDQDDIGVSSLTFNGQEVVGSTETLYVPIDYDFADIAASTSSGDFTIDISSIDVSSASLSTQTIYINDNETNVSHPYQVPLAVGFVPNGLEDNILDYALYYKATYTNDGAVLIGGAGSHTSSMLRSRVSSADNYPQGDTTVSMWFKFPSGTSGQKRIIQWGAWGSDADKGLGVFFDTRTGVAGHADGNAIMEDYTDGHFKIRLLQTSVSSGVWRHDSFFKAPPVVDGQWHLLTIQLENAGPDDTGNTLARVYVDGVKINDSFQGNNRVGQDVDGNQELRWPMNTTYRGAYITVGRGFIGAEFDALNIESSISTPTEILSSYQSGRNNFQGSVGLEEHSDLSLYGNAQLIDGVLHLDGTSGTYASLPHSLDYERENGDLTVSMWIKPNSLPNNWNGGLVSKMGAGWSGWITAVSTMEADDGSGVMTEGGLQTSLFGSGNANNRSYPVNGITLNEWQHVAFVMVAVGEYKMYHNGVEILSYNPTNRPQSTTGALRFGGWGPFNGYEGFFDGQIDGIKIEKSAKSASEILSEYNSGF